MRDTRNKNLRIVRSYGKNGPLLFTPGLNNPRYDVPLDDSSGSSSSKDAGDDLPPSSSMRPGEEHAGASGGEGDGSGRPVATGIEAGGFSYRETAERDMIDLGADILHHMKYVVFRRGGTLKVGPSGIGVAPRSWRFTPASRRILFEVDVPARGITLR